MKCGREGCKRQFTTDRSLKRHMQTRRRYVDLLKRSYANKASTMKKLYGVVIEPAEAFMKTWYHLYTSSRSVVISPVHFFEEKSQLYGIWREWCFILRPIRSIMSFCTLYWNIINMQRIENIKIPDFVSKTYLFRAKSSPTWPNVRQWAHHKKHTFYIG